MPVMRAAFDATNPVTTRQAEITQREDRTAHIVVAAELTDSGYDTGNHWERW